MKFYTESSLQVHKLFDIIVMLMICKERNYIMNKNILIIDDDKEIVEFDLLFI